MKRIKLLKVKYLLLTFLLTGLFSCNESLELLPPSGLIRDEYWKTKEDVEAVLMAAYESFASMDRELFLHGELRGDLLEGGRLQSSQEQNIMENNIYPDNSFTNWDNFYQVVNYCNEVIKNAPLVQEIDNTFNDFRKQTLMAEAYWLRSLAYFYLVRIYNEVPLILEPSESDDVDFYVEKSSQEEVLTQMVADLTANREFAPSGSFPTIAENKGRASKAAYDALLADIALWRFRYDEVLQHVAEIERREVFQLLPSNRWFEIFYPGNSLEGIFEFQFSNDLNQYNSTSWLTSQNSLQYYPSQKAIEMFGSEYSAELIRGQGATIAEISDDNFIIWKYNGQVPDPVGQARRPGSESSSANWIIYRKAEILLMKAEALSQLERYQEAQNVLNVIRERANVSLLSLPNSRNAFEDAILEERALELAYEGNRWFDILRMGRRNNFARKARVIEIIVSNVPSTQKRILATKLTNPSGWYLPIYDEELERNRNLVQNPYYDF
ncbi:MAG: RagB/SusD family nutrient uptake outer membrane protein [Bacteroidales bacterium]